MNFIVVAMAIAVFLGFAYYLASELMEYIKEVDCRLCDIEDVVDNMRKRQEDDGK